MVSFDLTPETSYIMSKNKGAFAICAMNDTAVTVALKSGICSKQYWSILQWTSHSRIHAPLRTKVRVQMKGLLSFPTPSSSYGSPLSPDLHFIFPDSTFYLIHKLILSSFLFLT